MLTLPQWGVWMVSATVVIVGILGVLLLCLMASAALLDRITRLMQLHHCFIDFMFQWIRKRREAKEAPHAR